jgi:signal transduction histidine kinase
MASMSNRPNRTAGDQPQQRSPDRFDRVSNRSDRRSSRSDRARAFLAARPWIVDTLLWALPIAYVTVIFTLSQSKASEIALVPVSVQVGIVLVQTLPLGLRRTAPLLSSSLIAIGCLLTVLTMIGDRTFGIVAVPLTVYSTTAWGTPSPRPDRARSSASSGRCCSADGSISCRCRRRSDPTPALGPSDEYLLLATLSWLCVPRSCSSRGSWAGSDSPRRQEIEGIRERNRLLERERESETRLAADAERMRIAREMHDVIAHSLSVVIAQADGGRYAAKNRSERGRRSLSRRSHGPDVKRSRRPGRCSASSAPTRTTNGHRNHCLGSLTSAPWSPMCDRRACRFR